MDYQFKKARSREVQEWIVEKIKEILPIESIQIFSRLKGNVANDILNNLTKVGIAVVVSPYLPVVYENYATCVRVSEGVIAVSVIENVALNKLKVDDVEIHADNLLEAIIVGLYDQEFHNGDLQFEPVEDASPEDEKLMVLIQKIKLPITL